MRIKSRACLCVRKRVPNSAAWFLNFCRKRRGRCFHEAAFLNVAFLLTLRYNFDACVYIVQSLQGGSEEERGPQHAVEEISNLATRVLRSALTNVSVALDIICGVASSGLGYIVHAWR